jgi:hypothetical protein
MIDAEKVAAQGIQAWNDWLKEEVRSFISDDL